MSTDLIAALRAALDERETTAQAAKRGSNGMWRPDDSPYPEWGRIVDDASEVVTYDEGAPSEAQARHIAAHDPAFALADIAAKRKILDLHQQREPGWCETCDVPGDAKGNEHGCPTVLALAEAYGIRA